MSGSLLHAWEYLADDVWQPLALYSVDGAEAPVGLYGDLFVAVDDFLSPRSSETDLEAVRNDPDKARARFLALRGTDFVNEGAIARFLEEEAHSVIADYEIPGLEEYYRRLLRAALSKFNLRYRLEDPFVLRFLLPASFSNLYSELRRINSGAQHLADLWHDFEMAFDSYSRTQSDLDLRTSIARASNYLEGLAGATRGTSGTLGRLCDGLSDWPHDKVKEVVKSLYGFCSDYPGIRHAGTPANRKRQLDMRDSVAITVALISMAAYLTSGIDQAAVLGTGPTGTANPARRVTVPHRTSEGGGWLRRLRLKFADRRKGADTRPSA